MLLSFRIVIKIFARSFDRRNTIADYICVLVCACV